MESTTLLAAEAAKPTTKIDGRSLNVAAEKLARLRELMPEAFSEGKLDISQMRRSLGEDIYMGEERYNLNWLGKSEAYKEIQKRTTATLIPDQEGSVDFDTAENVFIEGENLEVLRVLQKSYFGKVKMIYIDPPYNTGSDAFVYPDDYAERLVDYEKRLGVLTEEGYINKRDLWRTNSRENGHYHSVWMTMLYPRLFLARNLLCESGIIFVSIDDNEQANLKLIMDDIFGEENFVASIIWQKAYSPINLKKTFSENHDYVLVYAKNFNEVKIHGLQRSDEANARYKNPDNDPRGVWKSSDLSVGPEVKSKVYPITTPSGRVTYPPKGYCWRLTEERFKEYLADNRIWFGNSGESIPSIKRFLTDVKDSITPLTLWLREEVGDSQEGKQETKALFGGEAYFETPKPVRLIKRMIQLVSKPDDNDIILDFFAGSGVTGQAVLEQNIADGGNRKFVLVQFPEPNGADSAAVANGLATVADVSALRLKKVIAKLKEKLNGQIALTKNTTSLSFAFFKLGRSNFKIWDDTVTGAKSILQQLDLFQKSENTSHVTTTQSLASEMMLKMGYELTTCLEKFIFDQTEFWLINNETFLALEALSETSTRELIATNPTKIIALESLFHNDDQFKTNIALQIEEASISFETF
jgi:adenine-specific DNA-methyltransferase